jgi:hypothetical protein
MPALPLRFVLFELFAVTWSLLMLRPSLRSGSAVGRCEGSLSVTEKGER